MSFAIVCHYSSFEILPLTHRYSSQFPHTLHIDTLSELFAILRYISLWLYSIGLLVDSEVGISPLLDDRSQHRYPIVFWRTRPWSAVGGHDLTCTTIVNYTEHIKCPSIMLLYFLATSAAFG